jgi:hypothetical protein
MGAQGELILAEDRHLDVFVGARQSTEVEVDGPPAGHHPRALEPRHLLRHQRDGQEVITCHCRSSLVMSA